MKHWNHIPHPEQNIEGFTNVALPSEAIKQQLTELSKTVSFPPLADSVLTLRRSLSIAPLASAAIQAGLSVRKDQKQLNSGEQKAFKDAVTKLVTDGTYAQLVSVHADMSHNMHGSMGPTGMLRFLGWHRRYILEFERKLVAADQQLRPGAADSPALPFWHWPDPFPIWLNDFLPARRPDTNTTPSKRKDKPPPPKPSQADVNDILTGFGAQLPSDPVNDYVRFTYGLEGWGKRSDGSPLPAHNQVHDWVGGIMSNTMYSPTDPVFWLHHGEVDRLWHVWQISNPNVDPPLMGNEAIMDPWTETYADIRAIEALGYTYGAAP